MRIPSYGEYIYTCCVQQFQAALRCFRELRFLPLTLSLVYALASDPPLPIDS